MALRLHWTCDTEGCHASLDVPYDPSSFEDSLGTHQATSGWIDGTWGVQRGWTVKASDPLEPYEFVVTCPAHAHD